MRIGLDIDGVIARSMTELVERYRQDYDKTYLCPDPYTHWKEYNVEHELEKADREWIDKQFQDPVYFLNAMPFEDAWYAVTRWFNIGHDVILVTRRHDNAVEATERWFDEWGIPYNKLHHGAEKANKWEILIEEECDIFVDDDPEEVSSAQASGVKSLLRGHSYNKTKNMTTIRDLRSAENWMNGLKK